MAHLLDVNRSAVLKKFEKDDQSIQEDLRILRQWLKTQPHLPAIDDVSLQKFLVNCKFSLQTTKETVDAYFTMRSYLRDFFGEIDPVNPALKAAFRVASSLPLKIQTKDHERVILIKIWDCDAEKYGALMHIKCVLMIENLRNRLDYEYGVQFIIDMAGVKLKHLTTLTPDLIIKCMTFFIKGYKIRITGIHLANPPTFADKFVLLLKIALSNKLYKRIAVHKTLESLHKRLPKELLPSDLGGNLSPSQHLHEEWIKELEANREWFLAQQKILVDESKRPDKLQDGHFGSIHGTFKKLVVD